MIIQKAKLIKLEDLARKLRVSKVTISKALRGQSDISEVTKIKVKDLAKKLGYVPIFMAKNLSSRKTNIIGLVVPKIAHFFFASVIESIYDTALENNYEIVLAVSQESAEREKKHILTLLSMNIDGLIISVTEETKDVSIFKSVIDRNIPLVFIDRVPEIKNVSSVTVDDEEGAFNAVENFIKKGITEIGYIGGYRNVNIGAERYRGFIKALNKYKIPINRNWITEGEYGEEGGYRGFKKIWEKGKLPKSLLIVTYPAALGMHKAAREVNLTIPEDLLVTCFGNNSLPRSMPSVFNFVDQPTKQIGQESVKLLLNLIENRIKKPAKIELQTRLLLNETGRKLVVNRLSR